MQSSRRSFLKTSGLAALLGVVGTAGCLETVDDTIGGDGTPGYANWLYDPDEVYDSDYVGFGTFDVQSVYENEDELPEGMMDQVEEANDEFDFVDLEAMEDVIGIAYGQPNQDLGGGSMVVSGEFDVDAITAEIEKEAPEEYETTAHGDFTLYTMTQEHPAEEGPDKNSATIGVSSNHVLVGGMQAPEATSADAVTTMIDAESGDADRLLDQNEDAEELVSQLGDATLVVGGSFDADLTNLTDDATPEEIVDAVDDLVAIGVASDVDGDTVEHTMAFVYASEDDASTDDVDAAIDRVEETNDQAGDQLEDRSVSGDGRTVLVSTTGDTEALFEPFGLFGAGPTGTATASGTATESQSVSVPQVRFDFQYRDDGKVEITHQSGDHVDNALHVRYEHDGQEVTESWASSDAIMAGDRYVTQRAPDPGSQLLLVWVEGAQSAVLGSYDVPE